MTILSAFIAGCSQIKINNTDDITSVGFSDSAVSKELHPVIGIDRKNTYSDKFEDSKMFYSAVNKSNTDIVIRTNKLPSDKAIINIGLSDAYMSEVPKGYGIELFALIYADGGMEIIDDFEIIDSKLDRQSRILSAELPWFVFTDKRTKGKFETVLTVSATPGEN